MLSVARTAERATASSTRLHVALATLACVPILFIAAQIALYLRNIPNWDEFETVLGFLNTLDAGTSWTEFVRRLAEVNNEHRFVASRALFAASYWLTGGVNFAVLAVLGDLFLLGALALLVSSLRSRGERLLLGALSSLLVVNLANHENLFWSGSSIDHFMVVLLVVAALRALESSRSRAFSVALFAALAATFSLAHGLLVWPIGAVVLGMQRRWRAFAVWCGLAALAAAVFFSGFHVNPGHPLPEVSDATCVVRFWLMLLGSPLAMGDAQLAMWLGAVLAIATGALLMRGVREGERFPLAVVAFGLGGLAMVAYGRALLSPALVITSRYCVLGALAWTLVLWVALRRIGEVNPTAFRRMMPAALASALVFNIAVNAAFIDEGASFADKRDLAATCFRGRQTLVTSAAVLFPQPAQADAVLHESEKRGIYSMPLRVVGRDVPLQTHLRGVPFKLDEVCTRGDTVFVRGWAYQESRGAQRDGKSVVFYADGQFYGFAPITEQRMDVVRSSGRRDVLDCGFVIAVPKRELPLQEFTIGVAFLDDPERSYVMSDERIIIEPQDRTTIHVVSH